MIWGNLIENELLNEDTNESTNSEDTCEKDKKKNKKLNKDQIKGDIEELIDKEQGIRDSKWGPDQNRPGRTGQRIKNKLKDWTKR